MLSYRVGRLESKSCYCRRNSMWTCNWDEWSGVNKFAQYRTTKKVAMQRFKVNLFTYNPLLLVVESLLHISLNKKMQRSAKNKAKILYFSTPIWNLTSIFASLLEIQPIVPGSSLYPLFTNAATTVEFIYGIRMH